MYDERIKQLQTELKQGRDIQARIVNQINDLQQKYNLLQQELLRKEGALTEVLRLQSTVKENKESEAPDGK